MQKDINWQQEIKKAWKIFLRGAGIFLRGFINVLVTFLLICALTGIIVACAFTIYIKNYVETEVDISKYKLDFNTSTTTRVYRYEFTDRSNRVGEAVELENERLYGPKNSIYIEYDKIPIDLQNAFIAVEDKRFRTHDGVDWLRTIKAGANFFLGFDNSSYGGSTLTQQLIKNVSGDDSYKIQRKIQEILWALDLEKKMEKEEILELYLNVINLGSGCYGVQAAANKYFNKDVSELSLIECAAIASITKNPSKYNPITHPEENLKRRNDVLDLMLEQGLINKREYDEAYDKELVLNVHDDEREININSWYTDMAIEDIITDYAEQYKVSRKMAALKVYNSGWKIYLLVDDRIQNILEQTYLDDSNFTANKSGLPAQSSAIVIDPDTGDILGVVGARGEKTGNRIQSYATTTFRSPGSSIKPLAVYGPALDSGLITYASVFDDTPYSFTNDTAWPKNFDYYYRGLTNVRYSVENSLNTVSLKVLELVGLDKSFKYCRDTLQLGNLIESRTLDDGRKITDKGYAALALGQLNYGLTVREMTAAYSIFANDGVYNEAHSYLKVEDSAGNTILQNDYKGTVAMSEASASIMTKLLQGVVAHSGYIKLDSKIELAAKTGSAGDNYDRWFIGYSPYYICGVWYGYEYPKAIPGDNPSGIVWNTMMTEIHQPIFDAVASGQETLKTFGLADNVIECTYCKYSGKLITAACEADPRGDCAETGYFLQGTQPTTPCDRHVMVWYDSATDGVACTKCPVENLVQKSLVLVDRNFPIEVYVRDTQYTCVKNADGIVPYSNKYYPYYQRLSGDGRYYGMHSGGGLPYNHACTEHADSDAFILDDNHLPAIPTVKPATPSVTAWLPDGWRDGISSLSTDRRLWRLSRR